MWTKALSSVINALPIILSSQTRSYAGWLDRSNRRRLLTGRDASWNYADAKVNRAIRDLLVLVISDLGVRLAFTPVLHLDADHVAELATQFCAECRWPFVPRRASARFCCAACKKAYQWAAKVA